MMTRKHPILMVIGTRPEAIKLAPVYHAIKEAQLPIYLCSTTQHDQLLGEVLSLFNITPDIELGVMRHGQDLFSLTSTLLLKLKTVIQNVSPQLIIAQGDTTTCMVSSLAAFYKKIPFLHIEAGLRTPSIEQPFPEELNRRISGLIATWHCAPTAQAAAHLMAQGSSTETIVCTGNTVVDALHNVLHRIENGSCIVDTRITQLIENIKNNKQKLILLTTHRRESFDTRMTELLRTVAKQIAVHEELVCVYPYHPNPAVIQAIEQSGITKLERVHAFEPLQYHNLVYILAHAQLIITDSGGIQEEAVSLGKRVLVARKQSERMEGVYAGLARIVGTDRATITREIDEWRTASSTAGTWEPQNVYGDGHASKRIVQLINRIMHESQPENTCAPQKIAGPAVAEIGYGVAGKIDMPRVCVLGLGYIGLPTSIALAQAQYIVHGYDIDASRVHRIMAGDPIIQEPEVYERLVAVLESGTFAASTEIIEADFYIIAVPTPFKEEKKPDLTYVFDAARALAPYLRTGATVIIESTIPVGATQSVATLLHELTGLIIGSQLFVAHCPERVLPGNIMHELVHNSRLIGGITHVCAQQALKCYASWVQGALYVTNAPTAEMVKLVENSSRDVQIAFANEVAAIAEAANISAYDVIELANKHPRVTILQPGCGVGGHCIAVDPWFLVDSFPAQTKLIHAARTVNDQKPQVIIEHIKNAAEKLDHQLGRPCIIGIMGLTYKQDVDDLRESPALHIGLAVHAWRNSTLLCEPHVNSKQLQNTIDTTAATVTHVLEHADVMVFLVKHTRFKVIDQKLLAAKTIIDACGLLHQSRISQSSGNVTDLWRMPQSRSLMEIQG